MIKKDEPRIFVTCASCWIYMARVRKYLQLNDYKVVDDINDASVCLMGACAALESTEHLNLKTAEEIMKNHPNLRLIFTGCGPKALPNHFGDWETCEGYSGVEDIFPPRKIPYSQVSFEGHPEIERIMSFSKDMDPNVFNKRHFVIQDILGRLGPPFLEKFQNHRYTDGVNFREETGYSIIISEGCNFRCAYCIEWKAQPPYRSVPKEEILAQIKKAHSQGFRKFSIICNDIASYGIDLYGRHTLKELLDEIFQKFPDSRFGIRYMSPLAIQMVFKDADLKAYADRLFFLRIPIQSASKRLLKKMNRPRNLDEVKKLLLKFREYYGDLLVTELIYGFPGETEEDIHETVRYLVDVGFDDFNLTEFSPRPGTPLENEKISPDAEKHLKVLEESRKYILTRYVHRVLSALSEFAAKESTLRFCKGALPPKLSRQLRNLKWGGWVSETKKVFTNPDFPGIMASLRDSTVRFQVGGGVDWQVFSVILKKGEEEYATNSLVDIFGSMATVTKRRRTATSDGLQFFVDKTPNQGDFLEITGDPGALEKLKDSWN